MSVLEVDPAILEDSDHSDYDSVGYNTSTESLTSSVNEYIFENGRRYHAYFGTDKNFMPTDEKEQDRLDLHHEILLLMLSRRLHLAPISSPHRILDVGTGTGIWAIDAADKYPSAEVVGTDLSPIQPSWVPPNCRFEVDDAERRWIFADGYFDFVHVRNLSMCIGDWGAFMSEVFRCTSPGGFAELGELGGITHSDDNTLHPGIARSFSLCAQAMEKIGRPFFTGMDLRQLLETAGFVDVVVENVKQPLGPWPRDERMKKVGAMNLLMGQTAYEAYGMAPLTRILGMSKEEALEVFAEAVKGVRNKNFHGYNFFHVAYGRKPE